MLSTLLYSSPIHIVNIQFSQKLLSEKKKKKRKQDKESHLFCALLHPLSSVKVRENSSNWLNVTPPSTSAKLQRRALPERKADIQWVLSSHYFLVVYYPLQTEDTRHNLEWL